MSRPKATCTQQRRHAHPLEPAEPRDDERAGDGAGAGERHHVAVFAGALVEDVAARRRGRNVSTANAEERRRGGEHDERRTRLPCRRT